MDNIAPNNRKNISFTPAVPKVKQKMNKIGKNKRKRNSSNRKVLKTGWFYTEPIPLIPKLRQTVLPTSDCSHLIREIFQEELQEEALPLQTAKILLQTSKKGKYVNKFAKQVASIYRGYDARIEDIRLTEKSTMCGSKETIGIEHLEKYDGKYPLIQSKDLLPETYERFIDYQTMAKKDFNQQKHASIPNYKPCLNTNLLITNYSGKKNYLVSLSNIISNESTPTSVIFIAEPRHVYFINCKAGMLQEHRVKLKNISSASGRFNLVPLPNDSIFSIYMLPLPGHTKMVAPGMSAIIVVQYTAQQYEGDVNSSTLQVNVLDGETVNIKITSYKEPPILIAAQILSPPAEEELSEKELMLIETIDCGNCFVGDSHTIKIELYNYGGKGRFWICNEEGWYFSLLRDLPINNILHLPPFIVNPFFFSVISEEVIDLNVTFAPTEFGLQTEILYVLCDNCEVRTIELVGDGIIYENSFLTFQNMEKMFPIDVDDDEKCEHWLDLGRVVPHETKVEEFTVTNNSGLKLSYRWEMRKAEIKKLSNYTLLGFSDKSFIIYPESGEILPKSTTTFLVACKPRPAATGQYRHVLRFIVVDLPQAAVTKDSHVQIIANERTTELIEIIAGEVEVWLQVLPLLVSLDPCIICITGDTLKIDRRWTQSLVFIRNHSNVEFNYKWETKKYATDKVVIRIYPKRGQVKRYSKAYAVVSIRALFPGGFRKKIHCNINDGKQILDMALQGEVSTPTVGASTESLDFGIVPHSSRTAMKFQVKSKSQFPAVWQLEEFRYNLRRQKLVPKKNHNMSAGYGYLCHQGSKCDVIYNLDTCRPRLWCSLLVLSSVTPYCCTPNAYILVTAKIIELKMRIKAKPDNTAILDVYPRLYVGLPTVHTFRLRNMTQAFTQFMWKAPTGLDSKKLKVRFRPNRKVVQPAGKCTVQITITPVETGNISQFYVPCYVGYNPIPAILSIVCQVDCLTVTFHMPKRSADAAYTEHDSLNVSPISWSLRGRDIEYPWIRKAKRSCTCAITRNTSSIIQMEDRLSVAEEIEMQVTDLTVCSKHSTQSGLVNDQETSAINVCDTQQELVEKYCDVHSSNFISQETVSITIVKSEPSSQPCIQMDDEIQERTKEFLAGVPRDVIQIEKPTVLRVMDINDIPSPPEIDPLKEQSLELVCYSKSSLQEYLKSFAEIEFLDTPCFEPVGRTFVVRNESPLPAVLKVSVSNFAEQHSDSDLDLITDTEAIVHGVKHDKWTSRVRKNCGLVVVTKQCSDTLEAYGVVPVTIWVYANTWGNYSETITCTVAELPPFKIQVMVRVTGNPVSFPMAVNRVNAVPMVRFGNLRYRDKPETRWLRLVNSSSVDVCIVWEQLLMDGNEENNEVTETSSDMLEATLSEASSEVSLMPLEVEMLSVCNDAEEETADRVFTQRVCKTRSVHSMLKDIPVSSYDGETSGTLFQVSSLELAIPARGEALLQLIVNPTYSHNRVTSDMLAYQATLVGFVHIEPEAQYQAGRMNRPYGDRIDPVVVQLEAALDVPQLEREDCQQDVHVTVSMPRLLALHENECQTSSQIVLFRNNHNTALTAVFTTEWPFRVAQVTTLGGQGVDQVTVLPRQRVEVRLECTVDKQYALETAKLMQANIGTEDEYKLSRYEKAYTFEYELKIIQENLMAQAMTLYVTTLCPVTYVSSDQILFGQVYVEGSKTVKFRIENKSDVATKYRLTLQQERSAFSVTPLKGVVPATSYPDVKGVVEISVTFTPSVQGEYHGRLLLTTYMRCIKIRLYGFASKNQQYKT